MRKIGFGSFVFILLILAIGPKIIPTKVDAPLNINIETTTERVARGDYLANHVWVCMECHSQKNDQFYSDPVKPGTEGMGGLLFDSEFGKIYASNITPHKIDNWTDGELLRAITEGLNKNGDALFPFHPYTLYGSKDLEDVYSVITYLRTLPSIKNDVPKRDTKLWANVMVRLMPKPATFIQKPDSSNTIEHGKYLSGVCARCHTPQTNGKPNPEMFYAGGLVHPLSGDEIIRSSNLTPDLETGIGNKSRENFIGIFKAFDSKDSKTILIPKGARESDTPMAWTQFAGMTENDLGAIYDYLHTLPPITNRVEKYGVK
ncbi:MAG: cytochrome C [Candidatus Marinimicrobia bacterium]|jgi:mono/diheme cytochrome c family protein|nr:cytochrome C [Candidatus Neomarinimicrobiota bacterium]MBT3839773.1 cytochrome C [Candidatus Neomarinimicrobiota bacterium]MBT3999538.1 cytochrome C [Candidatus Neomarinimicrobiota bacterium]MBT4283407.1 cytochrome C [Candidatus Neomarinimicrobiota bacterium]MBT4578942.1 cytochrome C [Candidatus Neomarinimicrobiota bacterium]